MPTAIQVAEADSVATLLDDASTGDPICLGAGQIVAATAIGRGHKVALRPIRAGEAVTKFGFPIGTATEDIPAGAHVHTHNLSTALQGKGTYRFEPAPPRPAGSAREATWRGYLRADGKAGTRNEIWILPTVGCVNHLAQRLAERGGALFGEQVDGIFAYPHPFGCSQLGADLEGTRQVLASLAAHPNAGGVLLVGLGCESNQLSGMMEAIPEALRAKVRTCSAQAAGDEFVAGLAALEELVAIASRCTRRELSLGRLAVGLKCGGSDGLSGLTANPLVGRIADAVTAAGGTAILSEIPEIFGAEHILMQRAATPEVFAAAGQLVNDFKAYFLQHGEPVSENPSPGNLAGGITTLEEKSLGAVQKGGQAVLQDVLRYGQRTRSTGLSLLEAPGNDAVSSTAMAAAGANVILFTTGRGTPLGFPVPTVKIASNGTLAARKPHWIDFDGGTVLESGMDAAFEALLRRVLSIASGEETAAERSGHREIAVWKRGVTL